MTMSKGPILRVPEGKPLPPQIQRTLEVEWPSAVREYYDASGKPNHKHSISQRITSIYSAFEFLFYEYPPSLTDHFISNEMLIKYVKEMHDKAITVVNRGRDPIAFLHKELEKFTIIAIQNVMVFWQRDQEKAIGLLNEAEQYVLMDKGRNDLVTVVHLPLGGDIEYFVQLDRSLAPYSDRILSELELLKKEAYPKTPGWFRTLSEDQQAYFCYLNPDCVDVKAVIQDFNDLLADWALVKASATYTDMDWTTLDYEHPSCPAWFKKLKSYHQEMIKVLAQKPASIDEGLEKFKSFLTKENEKIGNVGVLAQLRKLPQWYWVLEEHQQYFFEAVLKKHEDIKEAISFLSSRHRTLPMPANFAEHSLWGITNKGDMHKIMGVRMRSAHVSSRRSLHYPQAVQRRHVDANLDKVMELAKAQQTRSLQTLISPVYVPSRLMDVPDLKLFELACAAVSRRKDREFFITTNHPQNVAKYISYTAKSNPDCSNLISKMEQLCSSVPGLSELLSNYKDLLNSSFGTATIFDYTGRELFFSSLEQLMILTIGGYPYGSCVSGKDRKAIELMHTDAMLAYKIIYNEWPLFSEPTDSERRLNFIMIFSLFYLSRHQHRHAGQNAPGADGLKTPESYLPADIVEVLNQRLGPAFGLKDDDRLASDNEIKAIVSDLHYSFHLNDYNSSVLSWLISRRLGEELCTKIYNNLFLLINETELFRPPDPETSVGWILSFFTGTQMSVGIKKINELMRATTSGDTNVERLEKILYIVARRPVASPSRSEATNAVYNCLRALLNFQHDEEILGNLVDNAEKAWQELFAKSKEMNKSKSAKSIEYSHY